MKKIFLLLFLIIPSFLSVSGCGSRDIIKEHEPCGCISTCSCMQCVLASRICTCEKKGES